MELMADNDYEDRFWDILLKRMSDQDRKLDELVAQTRRLTHTTKRYESSRLPSGEGGNQ